MLEAYWRYTTLLKKNKATNERYKKRHNQHVQRNKNFNIKERFPSKRKHKLQPKVKGSFRILEKFSDNAYKLDLGDDMGVSATFNIGALSPYYDHEELGSTLFKEGGNEPSMVQVA